MKTLADIDWTAWNPRQRAVLCFILRPGEVLLILKKRGLGAGKINAPGGKIEPGETPYQAAIRETREEVGLIPHAPYPLGELSFQFTDGLGIHCTVFRAEGCEGALCETDEAEPRWTPLGAVPYEAMWADDVLWMPHLLAGRLFVGRFLFDGETMLDHCLELPPRGAFGGGSAA